MISWRRCERWRVVCAGADRGRRGQGVFSGMDLEDLQALVTHTAEENHAHSQRIATPVPLALRFPEDDDCGGERRGHRGRRGAGYAVRLYAGLDGGELWLHRGADWICAGDSFGVSAAAGGREACPRSAADRAHHHGRRGLPHGAGERSGGAGASWRRARGGWRNSCWRIRRHRCGRPRALLRSYGKRRWSRDIQSGMEANASMRIERGLFGRCVRSFLEAAQTSRWSSSGRPVLLRGAGHDVT